MKTIQTLVLVGLLLSIAVFLYTHWRSSSGAGRRGGASPRSSGARPTTSSDARSLLQTVNALQGAHAQWPDIFRVLNPTQDPKVQEVLISIRGPHMFDPRTALGVIETGCRAVAPDASSLRALEAARESMEKVVGFGR